MKTLALLLLLQSGGLIDVNTATKAELTTIPGISPTVADHIIRDRPYQTVEDVQGPVPRFMFEKIRTRITVTSSTGNAVTPISGAPQPQRREVQVIRGNRIEKILFDAPPQEKGAEAPTPSPNPPQ
jgi:hypothetical protein